MKLATPNADDVSSAGSSVIGEEAHPEESKCPMHRPGGGYSYDWKQLFKAAAAHGPDGSKPLSKEEQETAMNASNIGRSASETAGCPVKHGGASASASSNVPTSGCPVKHGGSSAYPEYDVYSQPVDVTNQMPKGAKTQLPNPTQTTELSTDRVSSSIPKGGTDSASTWTYPSPQQFYNALTRKGKMGTQDGAAAAAAEEDMASVVALHNNMNEKTWAKVVEWERQTYRADATPKLLKFLGRPHDLSPKARLKHHLLGHPLPYDRHDWTVLRDDGTTVRYVIDYYYDETRARETEESGMPQLHDRDATPSLLVDVRPALDGPGQLYARAVQMPYKILAKETTYEVLPLRGTPEMVQQVKESIEVWKSIQQSRKEQLEHDEAAVPLDRDAMTISDGQARQIALNFAKAMVDCRKARQAVEICVSEDGCSKASMDLTMCMGERLCPLQHKSLVKTLASDDDTKIEAALETLTECVMLRTAERRQAREQHPNLFQ